MKSVEKAVLTPFRPVPKDNPSEPGQVYFLF
jgi:hypothetical protein